MHQIRYVRYVQHVRDMNLQGSDHSFIDSPTASGFNTLLSTIPVYPQHAWKTLIILFPCRPQLSS